MAFTDEEPDAALTSDDEVSADSISADRISAVEVEADDGDPEFRDDQEYREPPVTGDPAVDEVVAEVARAVMGPLEGQLAVYDTAYRTLQDRLADVEG